MPKIRRPRSMKQGMWGGWTYPNCWCEMDRLGKKIVNEESNEKIRMNPFVYIKLEATMKNVKDRTCTTPATFVAVIICLAFFIGHCSKMLEGPDLDITYWQNLGLKTDKARAYATGWKKATQAFGLEGFALHITMKGEPNREEVVSTAIEAVRRLYLTNKRLKVISVFVYRKEGYRTSGGGYSGNRIAQVTWGPNDQADSEDIIKRRNYEIATIFGK